MELVLNLVWLAVVLASAAKFAIWSGTVSRRRAATAGVALVCILALAFPIISITDDLHWNKAMAEEARSAAIVRAPAVLVVALIVVGLARAAAVSLPDSGDAATVVVRGPPV